MAIVAVLSIVSCLRLDVAIPLADNEREGMSLLITALLAAFLFALFVALVAFLVGDWALLTLGHPELSGIKWLLPIGVWLAGSYSALQYWSTYKSHFASIAKSRLAQAGGGITTQIGLGVVAFGPLGLLLGQAIFFGAGVLYFLGALQKKHISDLGRPTAAQLHQTLRKYKKFPLFSTFDSLAGEAAIQIPIVLIAILAVGPEAGFVFLAVRVIGNPSNILGAAVGQVFIKRASVANREGGLAKLATSTVKNLALLTAGPLIFFAMIAPGLFEVVFDEQWRRAGELVAWMIPWFFLKLLAVSIGNVMYIRSMQKAMLILMIFGLILRVSATIFFFEIDPTLIVHGYAISGAIFYFLALIVFSRASGMGLASAASVALNMFLSMAFGGALACAALFFTT